MIRSEEILSLIPISLLALFYFITDLLTFNKLIIGNWCPRTTTQQLVVLFGIYPLWIFLIWIENMSTYRGDIFVLSYVGFVNTIVGYGTTVFILNEKMVLTKQQIGGLMGRFVVNALWQWNNYLVFSIGSCNALNSTNCL